MKLGVFSLSDSKNKRRDGRRRRPVKYKKRYNTLGQTIRKQDATYFDTEKSRAQADVWTGNVWLRERFGQLKLILFVGFYLLFSLFRLLFFNLMSSSDPRYFTKANINFIFSEGFSLFILSFFSLWPIILSLIVTMIVAFVLAKWRKRQDGFYDDKDLSGSEGDASLVILEDFVGDYVSFPDRGAHSKDKSADISGMASHAFLSNAGINKKIIPKIKVDFDKPGFHFGYAVHERDDKGNIVCEEQSLFDTEDAYFQYDRVGMSDERYQILHDPRKFYISRKKRIKWADYINDNFYIPEYETERPTGVYFVDTSAMNAMVVAMTRGNKGQCYIIPYIDCLTRQAVKPNIVVNDPKGELFLMFYKTYKTRGFSPVVFNLLDSMFTDQYNPLAPAISLARKGYLSEPRVAVTTLANTFFPIPKQSGSDPFWTKAEQQFFSALVFVLIDLYYEEEQDYLRKYSHRYDMATIQRDLDELWSNVTLSNVYQMVSILATQKFSAPDGAPDDMEDGSNVMEKLMDLTSALPLSNIRQLFAGPFGNLKSMAESEKMRSTIYGLTLTEMAFFTEGPVQALTNVSPRRSFDILSMSFPRRFEFKLNEEWVEDRGYISQAVDFELYRDPEFKVPYEGDDYRHSTRVDTLSWIEMRFKGLIEDEVAYVKINIRPRGERTSFVYETLYAKFIKGYAKTPDGRGFSIDSILGEFQAKDGLLIPGQLVDGTFIEERPTAIVNATGKRVQVFELTEAAYIEKPIALHFIIPPSKTDFAKMPLMFIHALFNMSVENAYLSKDNGKPLLKTKYILDELGNLVYNGSGIQDFATKLSIGLAQGQEFTLIFQTLQQILDVYGQTADKTIASNSGFFCLLLSSDLDMLETVSKQAGTHHVAKRGSKSNTVSMGTMVDMIQDEVSYTTTKEEKPVIPVNRLQKMTNGEMVVLGAIKRSDNDGSNRRQNPILNTQDTSLPMAYALYKHGIEQKKFSMLTVPVENATFRSQGKLPPFMSLVIRRARQVVYMPEVIEGYKEDFNMDDLQFDEAMSNNSARISRELMRRVNRKLDEVDGLVDAEDEDYYSVPEDAELSDDYDDILSYLEEDEQARHEANNAALKAINGNGFSISAEERKKNQSVENEMLEQHGIYRDAQGRVYTKPDRDAIDKDLARGYLKSKEEADAKQYGTGNNLFSYNEMELGHFKTCLESALSDLTPARLDDIGSAFKIKRVPDGTEIYYNDRLVFETKKLQQKQTHIVRDYGATPDELSVVPEQLKLESVVEQRAHVVNFDALYEILRQKNVSWDDLLGVGFASRVMALFKA